MAMSPMSNDFDEFSILLPCFAFWTVNLSLFCSVLSTPMYVVCTLQDCLHMYA